MEENDGVQVIFAFVFFCKSRAAANPLVDISWPSGSFGGCSPFHTQFGGGTMEKAMRLSKR